MIKNKLKFITQENPSFYPRLTQEINRYFKENKLSQDGGKRSVGKAVVMLGLYLLPLLLMIIFSMPWYLMLLMALIMGMGKAGIGMAVMHDALHGSFSKKSWVNRLFGASIYLLGGNKLNWHIQHNVYHHTYPNVHTLDEDVSTKAFILRLSSEAQLKKVHRFQHLYAFFLYPLMTLSFFVKDFRQLIQYSKNGDTLKQGYQPKNAFFKLVFAKIIYSICLVIIPAIIIGLTWWQTIIGFLIVHGICRVYP